MLLVPGLNAASGEQERSDAMSCCRWEVPLVAAINPDLSMGLDVVSAESLPANRDFR